MKRAICIGCGCDEFHACRHDTPLIGASTCWWLHFDAAANVGVCSACPDLAQMWKAGERRPQLEDIALRYYRQALFVFDTTQGALAWMTAPHPVLGGRSPQQAILEGSLARVREVLDEIRVGMCV